MRLKKSRIGKFSTYNKTLLHGGGYAFALKDGSKIILPYSKDYAVFSIAEADGASVKVTEQRTLLDPVTENVAGGKLLKVASNSYLQLFGAVEDHALLSEDGGLHWTAYSFPQAINYSTHPSATDGNSTVVITDGYDNETYYSTDKGKNWTASTIPLPSGASAGDLEILTIDYSNNLWVMTLIDWQSTTTPFPKWHIYTSSDGITWTDRHTENDSSGWAWYPEDVDFYMKHDGTSWVVFITREDYTTGNYYARSFRSTDGVTWVLTQIGGTDNGVFSCYYWASKGYWVAHCEDGIMYYSNNSGATWSSGGSLTTNQLLYFDAGDVGGTEYLWAGSANSKEIFYSSTGTSFTSVDTVSHSPNFVLGGLRYLNGKFVVFGNCGGASTPYYNYIRQSEFSVSVDQTETGERATPDTPWYDETTVIGEDGLIVTEKGLSIIKGRGWDDAVNSVDKNSPYSFASSQVGIIKNSQDSFILCSDESVAGNARINVTGTAIRARNFLIGGYNCYIEGAAPSACGIIGGDTNYITEGNFSYIIGGNGNEILNGDKNVILSSVTCIINAGATTVGHIILGGSGCEIESTSSIGAIIACSSVYHTAKNIARCASLASNVCSVDKQVSLSGIMYSSGCDILGNTTSRQYVTIIGSDDSSITLNHTAAAANPYYGGFTIYNSDACVIATSDTGACARFAIINSYSCTIAANDTLIHQNLSIISSASCSMTGTVGKQNCAIVASSNVSFPGSASNSIVVAGNNNTVLGLYAFCTGYATGILYNYTFSCGQGAYPRAAHDFVHGNTGTSPAVGNNTARLTGAGQWRTDIAATTPESDYAEYFEWDDGNVTEEDRTGLFVRLVDGTEKIKKYDGTGTILGIVSATPGFSGNSAPNKWSLQYQKDIWGRLLKETYDVYYLEDNERLYVDSENNKWEHYPQPANKNGTASTADIPSGDPDEVQEHPKMNPDFDPDAVYLPRDERIEWAPIGLLGQLLVKASENITGDFVTVGTDGMVKNWIDESIKYPVMKNVKDKDTDDYGIVKIMFSTGVY